MRCQLHTPNLTALWKYTLNKKLCVYVCVLQSRSGKSARKHKILSLLLELFFIHAVILYLRKLSTAQIK